MTAYEHTLAELYALEAAAGIDLTLDRVRAALTLLGAPERRFRALHVAGTNGKGSTVAMLDAALRQAGYRVGLYTSPHLVDFTERIRIDGRMIAAEEVVARVRALRSLLDTAGIALTFFELVTVLAFDAFARHGVEVAVLEVGLGGRLDATNVVTPIVTAITGIAHDHEGYLGETLTAIATEKAGIMKADVPVVIGPVSEDVRACLLAEAARVGARPLVYGRDFEIEDAADGEFHVRTGARRRECVRVRLSGRFQRANAAVALATLDEAAGHCPVSEDAVRAGLATVSWPGRLDRVHEAPLVMLDAAHNPAGAATLRQEMDRVRGARKVHLVFGVMRDKNWRAMWDALRGMVGAVVVTEPPLPRALPADALAAAVAGDVPVRVLRSPREAIASVVDTAARDDVVLVTGSLFLVGAVYPFFLARRGARHLFDPWHASSHDVTHAPA